MAADHIPHFIISTNYHTCRQTQQLIEPGETCLLIRVGFKHFYYSFQSKLYRIVLKEFKNPLIC